MVILRTARGLTVGAVILGAGLMSATPASAATRHHHHRHHHAVSVIPQHNAGDQDGDNNGHSSDGYGNT